MKIKNQKLKIKNTQYTAHMVRYTSIFFLAIFLLLFTTSSFAVQPFPTEADKSEGDGGQPNSRSHQPEGSGAASDSRSHQPEGSGGQPNSRSHKPALQFKLLNLSGKEISLSDFTGKPVILFFWTTWCPFCREEMSMLQNEYKNITAGGITLLAIDIGEPQEKVQKFLKNRNTEFDILLDINSKVAYSYNLIGVPTFVLIDAQGKIRFQGNSFPDNYLSILK